jgi:hypothetical protein
MSFLNGKTLYKQTAQEIKNKIIKNNDMESCIHKNDKLKLATIKDIMDKLKIKNIFDMDLKKDYCELIKSKETFEDIEINKLTRIKKQGNTKLDIYKTLLKIISSVIPEYVQAQRAQINKTQLKYKKIKNKLLEDIKFFEYDTDKGYLENVFKK